ncbi:hypothetical protein EAI_04871, partial [Harpegnathos saltator]
VGLQMRNSPYHPYSPDPSPTNSHLFNHPHSILSEKIFQTESINISNVKSAFNELLAFCSSNFYVKNIDA